MKLDKMVITGCYDAMDIFSSKKDAIDFYRTCALSSEGSEHERYSNILVDLTDPKCNVALENFDDNIDDYLIDKINIISSKGKTDVIELPDDLRYNMSIKDGISGFIYLNQDSSRTWDDVFDKQREINFNNTKITPILNMELEDDNTPFGGLSFAGETVKDFIEEAYTIPLDSTIEILNEQLKFCGIKEITKESFDKYVSQKENSIEL